MEPKDSSSTATTQVGYLYRGFYRHTHQHGSGPGQHWDTWHHRGPGDVVRITGGVELSSRGVVKRAGRGRRLRHLDAGGLGHSIRPLADHQPARPGELAVDLPIAANHRAAYGQS